MPWKLRAAAADIVHVHVPNPAGVLAVMASGYKGKLIVTWHSDVVRQRRLAQIFAPIQRRFLSRCSAIIATSRNSLPQCRWFPACAAACAWAASRAITAA